MRIWRCLIIDRIGKVLFGNEVESLNCPGTIGGESSTLPPRSDPKNTRVKHDLIFRVWIEFLSAAKCNLEPAGGVYSATAPV
jgi:hypothetical protein